MRSHLFDIFLWWLIKFANAKGVRFSSFQFSPVCTAYESPFVSELDVFTKSVDGTYRHNVLGFVFN